MQEFKYYRLLDDTFDDEGIFYYEVKEHVIIRQLCLIHERIYWANENDEADERYGFPDQLEFIESEIPDYCCLESVTSSEFEVLWEQGLAQWD